MVLILFRLVLWLYLDLHSTDETDTDLKCTSEKHFDLLPVVSIIYLTQFLRRMKIREMVPIWNKYVACWWIYATNMKIIENLKSTGKLEKKKKIVDCMKREHSLNNQKKLSLRFSFTQNRWHNHCFSIIAPELLQLLHIDFLQTLTASAIAILELSGMEITIEAPSKNKKSEVIGKTNL